MIYEQYNNQRVIWESKTKQIAVIVLCFGFVAMAVWTSDKYSSFSFWATIVFFGGGGLLMLARLLNPKNLFVTHDSALGKIILAERFTKQQEDLGFFSYDETGFNFDDQNEVVHYNWTDISSIFCYKEDRFTTDEIL